MPQKPQNDRILYKQRHPGPYLSEPAGVMTIEVGELLFGRGSIKKPSLALSSRQSGKIDLAALAETCSSAEQLTFPQ